MTSNQRLMERREQAVARGVANLHPLFAASADNARIIDADGREYIDFASGIAVLNTGHRHPQLMAAVRRQLDSFTHTCFHVMGYESYVELAEKLNRLTPGAFPKKSLLVNTGAEAVENAIKIARSYTGRPGVIAFDGGFHGRTLLTMGLTGKVMPYKKGFGPMPAGIHHAAYPNALHGISVEDALRSLEDRLRFDIEPEAVAAMIVEPVMGEGGFYVAPPAFLRGLRDIASRHGIVLIADEVQSGFGRTGRMFAVEHAGVEPDLITMAKSLAGGFPLAAVTGRAEIMDAPHAGGLGGTYGGNPVAVAAALAVLEVLESEGLLDKAERIGQRSLERLRPLQQSCDTVAEVRGLGAMIGIEFMREGVPAPDMVQAVVSRARDQGLLLLSCGMHGNVIRLLAPLTIPDEDLERGLAMLADAITAQEKAGLQPA